MKKLIHCLLIGLIGCASFAKASLDIKIQDCRNGHLEYLGELKILKDGKIFKTLKPEHDSEQKLTGLDLGVYKLVYRSIFEQQVTQEVKITEEREYNVSLCVNFVDYKKEAYKPIINQLKSGESYEVEMLSRGCFHATEESFKITKDAKGFIVKWGNDSKRLTENDIKAIQRFEIELSLKKGFGCTTVDTYTVTFQGKKQESRDGSCNWDGFIFLHEQLFGKK